MIGGRGGGGGGGRALHALISQTPPKIGKSLFGQLMNIILEKITFLKNFNPPEHF